MRRVVPLLVLLGTVGCSTLQRHAARPEASPPVAPPAAATREPAASVGAGAGPQASRAPQAEQALTFVVSSPNGAPVPVYASMAADSPVAFELEHGSGGDVLASDVYVKDGQSLTYWRVRSESGTGWIWAGHVAIVRRQAAAPAAVAAEAPPRSHEAGARTIELELELVEATHEPAVEHGRGTDALPAGAAPDVLTINQPGEVVDVGAHLVRGQYTIVDVFSPACGPCVRLAPTLERIAREHPRIVLRKIDINRPGARGIDWQSPVARALGVSSVPRIQLYDPSGELVASDQAALSWLDGISKG